MSSEKSVNKDSRKKELMEQLALLENEAEEPIKKEEIKIETEDEDKEIEKPKKRNGNKNKRTEKQIESLNKGREIRAKKVAEEKKRKEEAQMLEKKEIEKKLIEKAIKIKKKQLKKIEVLDEISDDETPTPIQKPKPVRHAPELKVVIPPNPYEAFRAKYNIR